MPDEIKTEQASPAPQIDQAAIQKQISEAAQKATEAAIVAVTDIAEKRAAEAASSRLHQAAAVLTGQPQQDPADQILKGFVADPIRTLKTVKDMAKSEMKQEIQQQRQAEDLQRAVVNPFLEQYPELKSEAKLALVEKLTEKHERSGLSYSEALKKGCEETVKEFGLKPVSEAQRQSAALYAGLPGGGGMGSGAPVRDEGKAQTDFISGMRERMSSTRTKK